jgi:pectate lyase
MNHRLLIAFFAVSIGLMASAQTPFVKGKVINQTLTEVSLEQDSVQLGFSQLPVQRAAKSDLVVAFGQVRLLESQGWYESAYATFAPYGAACGYNVYVKGGGQADYKRIDGQLVRNYGAYGRADVVGLRPADDYQLRIVPVDADGTEIAQASTETGKLAVKAYDRCGFAHFNYSNGVGAYKDDGTLKAGAQVVYVTAQTAKTVKARLSSGEFTGLQAILSAYEKGNVTTPLAVRIIGCVSKDDMDALGSSAEGIQIKGKNNSTALNITIEGIGNDATIKDMGFLVRSSQSVEVRNLGILYCMDDGLSFDTDNLHCWAHHIDFFYGRNKGGDQAKGDGSLDVKSDSRYMTFAYNHFWDSGKTSLCGMKSESGPNYITYHHNWFDHSDSRHPRVRTMTVHVYNNYYDGVAKYGAGATTGSSIFMDRNYFRNTNKPMMISLQGTDTKMGTDLKDAPTFSGEEGGMIKSYGNVFAEKSSNFRYATYQQNAVEFDAYEVADPATQVPADVKSKSGGNSYNNFDTDPQLMYAYSADAAQDVPGLVTGWWGAGRMGHGDFQWKFNNSTEDSNYAVIAALSTAVQNYQSALLGVFGEEAGQGGEEPVDTTQTGPDPVGEDVVFCTFDKNGTPSSSFFTVSGNGSNSKGKATIDGETYDTCLKMESSTSVRFTLSEPMRMTLYFADGETASIKIDGQKITGATSSVYSTVLQAGDHELTKDKSVNLFGIKLESISE